MPQYLNWLDILYREEDKFTSSFAEIIIILINRVKPSPPLCNHYIIPSVDDITIPSSRGNGVLHRVSEVFDCWFESGSMPYAQSHYPFENKKAFEGMFPADFIAEGIDQTRGWFYTLLVVSTALFGKPPFKNLIVNGLVLARSVIIIIRYKIILREISTCLYSY